MSATPTCLAPWMKFLRKVFAESGPIRTSAFSSSADVSASTLAMYSGKPEPVSGSVSTAATYSSRPRLPLSTSRRACLSTCTRRETREDEVEGGALSCTLWAHRVRPAAFVHEELPPSAPFAGPRLVAALLEVAGHRQRVRVERLRARARDEPEVDVREDVARLAQRKACARREAAAAAHPAQRGSGRRAAPRPAAASCARAGRRCRARSPRPSRRRATRAGSPSG